MAPVAAAVLAALGVQFVVIGSGALVLHGIVDDCPDLDIVSEPGAANLRALARALDAVALHRPRHPALRTDSIETVASPFGLIDVFIGRSETNYDALESAAATVMVEGVPVRVAAVDDVHRLRARFGSVEHGR